MPYTSTRLAQPLRSRLIDLTPLGWWLRALTGCWVAFICCGCMWGPWACRCPIAMAEKTRIENDGFCGENERFCCKMTDSVFEMTDSVFKMMNTVLSQQENRRGRAAGNFFSNRLLKSSSQIVNFDWSWCYFGWWAMMSFLLNTTIFHWRMMMLHLKTAAAGQVGCLAVCFSLNFHYFSLILPLIFTVLWLQLRENDMITTAHRIFNLVWISSCFSMNSVNFVNFQYEFCHFSVCILWTSSFFSKNFFIFQYEFREFRQFSVWISSLFCTNFVILQYESRYFGMKWGWKVGF